MKANYYHGPDIIIIENKKEIEFAGKSYVARLKYGDDLIDNLMKLGEYKSKYHDDKNQLEIHFNFSPNIKG